MSVSLENFLEVQIQNHGQIRVWKIIRKKKKEKERRKGHLEWLETDIIPLDVKSDKENVTL